MLRLNRGRLIGLALTTFIVYFLFLSSPTSSNGDFRRRTEEGLSRRHGILQGDLSDEAYRDRTNKKLDDILLQQQQQQQQQNNNNNNNNNGEGGDGGAAVGVAGRKTMQQQQQQQLKEKEPPRYPKEGAGGGAQEGLKEKEEGGETESGAGRQKVVADPARDMAREKLQEFLKKPVVIFSKSYCPHSKKAKELLLHTYKITPMPLVVELDQLTERLPLPPKRQPHEPHADAEPPSAAEPPTLGQKIQEILGEITGRRTVPNIVVGGTKSIGGNDLVWEMHEEGSLKEKIMALGGKRIVAVDEVDLSEGTSGR